MSLLTINQNLLTIIAILQEILKQAYRPLEIPVLLQDQEWLHTEDVMKIFKKSEKTIYNWRQSRALRHKIIGGTAYYLKSDVYKLV